MTVIVIVTKIVTVTVSVTVVVIVTVIRNRCWHSDMHVRARSPPILLSMWLLIVRVAH